MPPVGQEAETDHTRPLHDFLKEVSRGSRTGRHSSRRACLSSRPAGSFTSGLVKDRPAAVGDLVVGRPGKWHGNAKLRGAIQGRYFVTEPQVLALKLDVPEPHARVAFQYIFAGFGAGDNRGPVADGRFAFLRREVTIERTPQ